MLVLLVALIAAVILVASAGAVLADPSLLSGGEADGGNGAVVFYCKDFSGQGNTVVTPSGNVNFPCNR